MKTALDQSIVVPFRKQFASLATQADEIAIVSLEDMKTATAVLSRLNQYADSVQEKKESITNPANALLKAVRLLFKPIEDPCEESIKLLRNKISAYQTKQVAQQRKQEADIALSVSKGKISLDKAMSKIDKIHRPDNKIETEAGSLRFGETPTVKITDASRIPREYLVPDKKKIFTDLKEGKEVDGCMLEIIQVPVNYR